MEENVVRTGVNMSQKCSYCVITKSKTLLTAMRIALHTSVLNFTSQSVSIIPHRLSALFGR